jgi:hypothetical protein
VVPDYLNGLVTESPDYAGSAFCEAGGGGTSSCSRTYWARFAELFTYRRGVAPSGRGQFNAGRGEVFGENPRGRYPSGRFPPG